tara:strand:+ start:2796 stop:18506 length:15711 start_codon:yes stop_codon:yes gene_type:complete
MSDIDKRVQVNKIIESQLPEFLINDFPLATEFFKQYYLSQEYQGGPQDLISNFDQYIKSDNLVPEVITGTTVLGADVPSEQLTEEVISVSSTKGFPDQYGLIKIDSEIITYTGKTESTFTGCIRGFSGVTGYNVGISSFINKVNDQSLIFESTSIAAHAAGTTVTNLSVLFLQEFYRKLKKTFLPGLEDNDFDEDVDVSVFIKHARSFYQSKGIQESIRILCKLLYGIDAEVIDLEDRLIKASGAEFIRREIVIADRLSGDPSKLVGQTIYKSTDLGTNASVSEVEILTRDNKPYYKLSLFVGFNDRDLIEGTFTVPGKTKTLESANIGDSIISVDSTIGFPASGSIISGENTSIKYTSKSINQFFGVTGIEVQRVPGTTIGISTSDDIRSDEVIYGYEDGDLTKKVELRITGVLSKFTPLSDISLIKQDEKIYVKNVGTSIDTPKQGKGTYKEIFANSWIYNTNTRWEIQSFSGPNIILKSTPDHTSLRKGDAVDILRRSSDPNNQLVEFSNLIIGSIDNSTKSITLSGSGGSFNWDSTKLYDLRRKLKKASSDGIPLSDGNNTILSDVLNVYVDGDKDGYVASNSLPNYVLSTDVDIVGTAATDTSQSDSLTFSLDGYNSVSDEYNIFVFTEPIKFITGESLTYIPEGDSLPGLSAGSIYYAEVLQTNPGKIRLYISRSQIGLVDPVTNLPLCVKFKKGSGIHNWIRSEHYNRLLNKNSIIRKFPLSQDLFKKGSGERPVNNIGLMADGVEIRTPLSDDYIYYGPLSSIDTFNSGDGYDVVNPPRLLIDDSVGLGVTALAEPIISGSVKEVFVDPQDFDIDRVISIDITGGNGSGATLEPIIGPRFRELSFDSRDVFFAGGLSIVNETITFTKKHFLVDGDLVYYNNNGNSNLGIGVYKALSNEATGTLANGSPYHVGIINDKTVQLYESYEDAVSGINTIGLSTSTTASGIHKFRTSSKNNLKSVKVLTEGSGYQYRKLHVKPLGISTNFDSINFVNHGFSEGDLVEYHTTVGLGSTTPNAIEGLDSSHSYYVMKIDEDSFRLADAGIGTPSRDNYDRGDYVGLSTTGTGFQTFKYPDIKVSVDVAYATTATALAGVSTPFTFTPIVTGEIIGTYLYEEGSKYGSEILNHQRKPKVTIQNGKGAELNPSVVDGKLVDVHVLNKGKEYYSMPDLVVESTGITTTGISGNGAVIRPVIVDGKLEDVIVINPGIGYTADKINVYAEGKGKNALFESRVRRLTIDTRKRDGEYYLNPDVGGESLHLNVVGYTEDIGTLFNDPNPISGHSPIIGWAYDGNPIYGPYGYISPDELGPEVHIMRPGYKLDSNKVIDRPIDLNKFPSGYFTDDYYFDGSGDLDIHNGRFCKTPEFPNGVYAYFAGVTTSTQTNKLEPKYPYFIGNSYRSPFISTNTYLTQDLDFNTTKLSRNTFPHKVGKVGVNNDSIIESNEFLRQLTTVESVTAGPVDTIGVLDGGDGYAVGDFTVFDNANTSGSGLRGTVKSIVGIGISRIDTEIEAYENATFVWKNDHEVEASYFPYIELNNKDTVAISGLSSSIVHLTDSFSIGIKTDVIGLAKSMTANSVVEGRIDDIYVNIIPNTVSVGSSLRISDTEIVKVLNIFPLGSILRVKRYSVGIAHTYSSKIDVLNSKITIPVRTKEFTSTIDDLVYFNAPQSVGLGTTVGGGISVDHTIGETTKSVPIPTRTIYIPNHPFKTGQKLTIGKRGSATSLIVGQTDIANNNDFPLFNIPNVTTDVSTVYAINKGQNYVGLVTLRASIGSTSEGLFFHGNGSDDSEYFLKSNHDQVLGDINKIVSTVSTKIGAANTDTHGLRNSDVISLNVVPNCVVGLGSTAPLTVGLGGTSIGEGKLIINQVGFPTAQVDEIHNTISITDHGYHTGDRLFYDTTIPLIGLSTGAYYVYEVNSDKFSLGKTLRDVKVDPPALISIGSTLSDDHQVGLINPAINVVKNSKLTFNVSDPNLLGYDFKIFYDYEFKNEYNSSSDSSTFNVVGFGTVGVGDNSTVSLSFSKSAPTRLYYSLTKSGFISTADTKVENYSQINFVDSAYSGDYSIFGITSDTFKISPRSIPTVLTYAEDQCETIEYATESTNVQGTIKEVKTISRGYNYKSLPAFSNIVSMNGKNANIVALSTSIGRIRDVRIVDIGYEYSSDKTLSPEAFVSPVIRLDNLDTIKDIKIVDGGKEYLSVPDIVVYDPQNDEIVDETSLIAKVPNQSISEIDILAPIQGLTSVNHRIISVNNSNGVGINSIVGGGSGIVTCVLDTPINGFVVPPFEIGDDIFVEGVELFGESGIGTQQSSTVGMNTISDGDGYNSANYQFRFFKIQDFINSNPAVLKYSISGLTTNPGIAKTFQSGYATIVNRNKYPILESIQERGRFTINEKLYVKFNNTYLEQNLFVVDARDDYIKIDGTYDLEIGARIKGSTSNVTATVTGINKNEARFEVDYSNRQDYGWSDEIGKLDEDFQVIPNNDYYQNLSYSIKSPITWDKISDPVNRLVHPVGLKNFADVSVGSSSKVNSGYAATTNNVLVLDVTNERRVDTINNFDMVLDYDSRGNKSKFIQFENVKLTDYTKCKTNRVLIHDDISGRFSSKGLQDLFTEIEEVTTNFGRYLIQVVDPDTYDIQLTDLVVLTSTNNAYMLEKSTDFSNKQLGEFVAESDTFQRKTLVFNPEEQFDKDHDIKILKSNFNTSIASTGAQSIGSIDLTGTTTKVRTGITTALGSITNTQLTVPADTPLTSDMLGAHLSGDSIRVGTAITSILSDTSAELVVVSFNEDGDRVVSSTNQTVSATPIEFLDRFEDRFVFGPDTTEILSWPTSDFNALYANVVVQDDVTKQINYSEVNVDFDGTATYISEIYADNLTYTYSSSRVGLITARYDSGTDRVYLECENDRSRTLSISANVVGFGTTTAGIGTYRYAVPGQPVGAERSGRLESTYHSGNATAPILVTNINSDLDSSVKSLVRVSCGKTSSIHQVVLFNDASTISITEYPFVPINSTIGLGTFGTTNVGNQVAFSFYPDDGTGNTLDYTNAVIEVQAYNEVFNRFNDFANEPPALEYGPVVNDLILSAYDGANGNRANKIDFDLKHEGVPIYSKRFNPTSVEDKDVFKINNHFFNDNEELEYSAGSTFIGIGATAISIGSTTNNAGIITDIMPSNVYVSVINENEFQIFSRKEYVNTGIAITVTGVGEGNAHRFDMTKKLSKTVIGLDGIVQQPITFTAISHELDGAIGAATSQFVLSGISSIQPRDVLKIDNEYMKVEQVGFASVGLGTINDSKDVALGICTLPVVRVQRGSLGIPAIEHDDESVARVHRGSFNIVDSTVWFLDPPKGNTRERRSITNLPYVRAEFSGRTFLRQNYDTNMVFDDISDNFTGIGRTYSLTVGAADTISGVSIGNGILFINGVFQTPLTLNNSGNNYEFETAPVAGISSVVFTGISSENGQMMQSEFDINQNQLPRGGLIVSMGSTPGVGYAPLEGAKARFDTKEISSNRFAANTLDGIVGVGTSSMVNRSSLGIQTAAYDNITGIITVTTTGLHGFALGYPKLIKLKGLEFICPTNSVGTPDVSGTSYNSTTGDLTIKIAGHGLANGDAIKIEKESLTFTCTHGSGNHEYPRVTDPAYDEFLTVFDSQTDTFKVNILRGLTPTNTTDHTFVGATPDCIRTLNYVGFTTSFFQDTERPISVTGIISERTFEAMAGICTIRHIFHDNSSAYAYEYYPDLQLGSGYREPVAIGVTDIEFDHKFVSSADDSIQLYGGGPSDKYTPTDAVYTSHSGELVLTLGAHNLRGSSSHTITDASYNPVNGELQVTTTGNSFDVSNATYNPTSGDMVLTIGSGHYLTTSNKIKIAEESIKFTCNYNDDNQQTVKSYPRSSGASTGNGKDYAHNTWLPITATTWNTITVNVNGGQGAITDTSDHEFNSALPGAITSDHGFTTADKVRFKDNAITLTCEMDNHATSHHYPRPSDPVSGKWISVASQTTDSFVVNVGVSALLKFTPTDAEYDPVTGLMELTIGTHSLRAGTNVKIAEESLKFTCDVDDNTSQKGYPRTTDPFYTSGFIIQSVTDTTITLQVLSTIPSTNITRHTFVTADNDAVTTGGNYPHTFVSGMTGGLEKANNSVVLTENSLTFTCSRDNHLGGHTYPRTTDPAGSSEVIGIGKTTDTTIVINVGSGGGGGTGGSVSAIVSPNVHKFVEAKAGAAFTGGDYEHIFVPGTENTDCIAIDYWAGTKVTPTNATYDADTGNLVLTVPSGHGITNVNSIGIATNSLTFTCTRDNHATEHTYPRHTDPIHNSSNVPVSVVGNEVTVFVGKSPLVNRNITDGKYDPSTGELILTSPSHDYVGCSTITPSNVAYNQNSGVLTITKNGHGYQVNDKILIEDNSLTFTCTKDGNVTRHSYPRPTDYASGKWLTITNRTINTFKVNVNPNPSDEKYPHTIVDIKNGCILKSNDTVGIETSSLTFTCANDNHQTLHSYPRITDPAHRIELPVGKVAGDDFRVMVGKSPASSGGSLALTINNPGARYVNPELEIPDPVYENVPVIGISRLGVGLTEATGQNLLVNLDVGAAHTSIGIARSMFEIADFKIARQGHSFKVGDKLKPSGLVVDKRLQRPIQEFELEIVEVFNDYFAAWQFGELDFIDTISYLQDGYRRRFPLFFNGQLLSFEVDKTSKLSSQIDLNAVLMIFVNGVLQTPNIAYQFQGGTTFMFTEAPTFSDKVDIFFYKGEDGVDIEIVDETESIKVGDLVRINQHPDHIDENVDPYTITQESNRTIKEILGSDLTETTIYTGRGINEEIGKPLEWTKQKHDKWVKGSLISKSRESIEPQIYPTAKIIYDVNASTGVGLNGGIFVDDAESFFYEDENNPALDAEDRYQTNINFVDTLLLPSSDYVGGVVTANVSTRGDIESFTIENSGSGYIGAGVTLYISAPNYVFNGIEYDPTLGISTLGITTNFVSIGVGTVTKDEFATVGLSTFAEATANIVNGKIDSITIDNIGLGYTNTNPPQVILPRPYYDTEKITRIGNVQGFTGIITGISTSAGTNGHPLAVRFDYYADKVASDLIVGYPVLIQDTFFTVGGAVTTGKWFPDDSYQPNNNRWTAGKGGAAVTSVDNNDNEIVSIGSTYLDNIYKVAETYTLGKRGYITCNILSTTETITGFAATGYYDGPGPLGDAGLTTSLGRLSWGRIYGDDLTRETSPISIGVTGLTVDSGLTTFPTIQRRNYDNQSLKGLRNTGALRMKI